MFLVYCNDGEREYFGRHYVHPHVRKAWEFQFVTRGRCTRLLRCGQRMEEDPVFSPMAVVSGPESVHGWTAGPGEKCAILTFHFDEADFALKQVVGRTGSRCVPFPAREIPKLRALHRRCREARRQRGSSSFITYNIVALELTAFFLQLLPPAEIRGGADFGANKVIEALAWYEVNLARGPNLKDVAQAVQLSSTHLRRLFHRARGVSPQEAFTNVQFERAKELMLDASVSLERVAENSGFGSASAFSRAFKAEFGLSPKTYRARLLRGSRVPANAENMRDGAWLSPTLFCPTAPEVIVENVK